MKKNNNIVTFHFLTYLVKRREAWVLTWLGKTFVLAILIVIALIVGRYLDRFLAVNEPIRGRYLVVEGWMPTYLYKQALVEFNKGKYEKIIGAGVMQQYGDNEQPIEFFGAAELINLGLPADQVVKASGTEKQTDRTYHAAMAVNTWLNQHNIQDKSIDVVSIGAHARRSRLLYEKALGNQAKVGIIAIHDPGFDPDRWWQTSEGVRVVIGEAIAYVYARFFFSPP